MINKRKEWKTQSMNQAARRSSSYCAGTGLQTRTNYYTSKQSGRAWLKVGPAQPPVHTVQYDDESTTHTSMDGPYLPDTAWSFTAVIICSVRDINNTNELETLQSLLGLTDVQFICIRSSLWLSSTLWASLSRVESGPTQKVMWQLLHSRVRLPSTKWEAKWVKAVFRSVREMRKATITSRLSVCPHATTRLPLVGFWWNLIFQLCFFENLSRKFKFN